MTVPFSGLDNLGKTKKVAGYEIDDKVLSGIKQASRRTGVDFGYLMAQAAQESSFQSEAKAPTSSATGLYQFIDSTWLWMVHEHGAKHGLGDMSSRIQSDGRGGYAVGDPELRRRILELRKDPRVSAAIGAEFALTNKDQLEQSLGRRVGAAELYLAHFLGANGASRLVRAIERNASQPAAELLPQAAASNRAVFYNRETGEPRSVGEIYRLFARSIETKSQNFASLEAGGTAGMTTAPGTGRGFRGLLPAQAPGGASPTPPVGANDLSTPTMSLVTVLALAALDALDPADAKSGDQRGLADQRVDRLA